MDNQYWLDKLPSVEHLVGRPVLNYYKYGSHLYGTAKDESDLDCMVVVDDPENGFRQLETDEVDIHVYNQQKFQEELDGQSPNTLAAFFAPVFEKVEFKYVLDKQKLRGQISQKSDHSFVKAKKKNAVEAIDPANVPSEQYYLAKKSLFHAFRILDFGIQIASQGRIVDHKSCQVLNDDIMNLAEGEGSWEEWNKIYKPKFNAMKTEFRKYAPKA